MGLWIYLLRDLFSAQIKKKFHLYLLKITILCRFLLFWVNNLEVIELFKFLNPQIKLLDRKILSTEILSDVVKDFDAMMLEKLVLDRIGITFLFDG
jgi:hypothetical protein